MTRHLSVASVSFAALIAATPAAMALSGSQITNQNTAPVTNPDGYNAGQILRLPAPAMGPGATLGGQLITAHVANNAALALALPNLGRVRRDGFASAGDGGAADYTLSSTACSIVGGDGGSQVPLTAGGCANLDPSAIITPALFGATYAGTATSALDTTATQAAFNTGKTVYLPKLGGNFIPNNCLTLKTSSQKIYGDGKYNITILNVGTSLTTTNAPSGCNGIIQTAAGVAPGPTITDIGIQFAQPTTPANAAALNVYPPAFYLRATPGFTLAHISCFFSSTCIDMQGNSGGSIIDDLLFSAFNYGIQIDGSLDTVQMTKLHWFPFGMTSQQSALFTALTTQAISIGRMDHFIIRGGLFLGGTGITTFNSTASATNGNQGGASFGTVTDTDFDSYSGIASGAGTLTCANCIFTQGSNASSLGVNVYGGDVHIVGGNVGIGAPLTNASVLLQSGYLDVSGTSFNTLSFDSTSIKEIGGVLQIGSGVRFLRSAGTTYSKPTISLTGGRTQMSECYASDMSGGTGTFLSVGNDNAYNKIIGNSAPSWTYSIPSSPAGTYLYNN